MDGEISVIFSRRKIPCIEWEYFTLYMVGKLLDEELWRPNLETVQENQ